MKTNLPTTRVERLLDVIHVLYPKGIFFSSYDLEQYARNNPTEIEQHFQEGRGEFLATTQRLGELVKPGELVRVRARRSTYGRLPMLYWVYTLPETDLYPGLIELAIEGISEQSKEDFDFFHSTLKLDYAENNVGNIIKVGFTFRDDDDSILPGQVDWMVESFHNSFTRMFAPHFQLDFDASKLKPVPELNDPHRDLPIFYDPLSIPPGIPDRLFSGVVEEEPIILNRPSSHEIYATDNREMIHTLIKAFLANESEREMIVDRAHVYDGYSIQDKIRSLVNLECLYHGTPVPAIWDRLCDELKAGHGIDMHSIAQHYRSISPGGSDMGYLDVAEKIGYLPVLLAIAERLLPMKKEENPLIEELKKCLDCPVPF